jgi:hypothetical protein
MAFSEKSGFGYKKFETTQERLENIRVELSDLNNMSVKDIAELYLVTTKVARDFLQTIPGITLEKGMIVRISPERMHCLEEEKKNERTRPQLESTPSMIRYSTRPEPTKIVTGSSPFTSHTSKARILSTIDEEPGVPFQTTTGIRGSKIG